MFLCVDAVAVAVAVNFLPYISDSFDLWENYFRSNFLSVCNRLKTIPAKIALSVGELNPKRKAMNGLSLSELCCLFCCPPCPGRIASKLAFLPPECSYELKADETSPTKFSMTLLDRADWQYSEREKECFEAFYTRSSRGNRIACLFVRCSANAR